ncbi:MAG: hypothetical protein JST13_08390 [Bacteroidetes bacterium]|nr:hypothetical protein [Bacteroidota bacterium]
MILRIFKNGGYAFSKLEIADEFLHSVLALEKLKRIDGSKKKLKKIGSS